MIVVDTGPLYAAADSSDAHHDECAAVLEDLERPLVMPVSVETSYLVEHRLGPDAEARFLTERLGEEYRVEQLAASDLRRMADLVRRYAGAGGPRPHEVMPTRNARSQNHK